MFVVHTKLRISAEILQTTKFFEILIHYSCLIYVAFLNGAVMFRTVLRFNKFCFFFNIRSCVAIRNFCFPSDISLYGLSFSYVPKSLILLNFSSSCNPCALFSSDALLVCSFLQYFIICLVICC